MENNPVPESDPKAPQDMTVRELEHVLAPEPVSDAPAVPAADLHGKLDSAGRFVRDVIVILAVVLIVRTVFASPFRISGTSMEESYHDGELIVLDHFSYFDSKSFEREIAQPDLVDGIWSAGRYLAAGVLRYTVGWFDLKTGDPQRGDAVVFKPHAGNGKEFYIKRVIGIPGDTVRIRDGKVYLKPAGTLEFTKLDEKYLSPGNYDNTQLYGPRDTFVVPSGKYFLLGDNRGVSSDSRSCFRFDGCAEESQRFIERYDIMGKVLLDVGQFSYGPNGLRLFWKPRWLDTPRTWDYPELKAAK